MNTAPGAAGGAYFRVVVAMAATLWLLITIRDFLQPLLIALVVWALINALASAATRALRGPQARPDRVALGLSALALLALMVGFAMLIAHNVAVFSAAAPVYEANIDAVIAAAAQALGLPGATRAADLLARIDLQQAMLGLVGSAASAASALIVILFYVIFMFVEQAALPRKLAALLPAPARLAQAQGLFRQIAVEIERYLSVKLALGAVQAIPTYLLLAALGVDGASFWALVIFVMSFVPTIGTLVGILFPSVMALAQFGAVGPFLWTLLPLAALQLLASNALEPRMMGKSLNLSPLAVFAAIFAGGALWGIVGALIVVPVLSIALIVFARIPAMRPVAILLSADGALHEAPGAPVRI